MTNELGAEARALIGKACGEEPVPGSHELDRIRKNVVAGATGSALLLAAPHVFGSAAAVTPLALVGTALKGAALGTVVALGGFSLDRFVLHPVPDRGAHNASQPARGAVPVRSLVPTTRVAVEPMPPAPAAADSPPLDLETQTRASTAKRPAANGARAESAVVADGALEASADLREETALLGRVQQELRAGRGAEALALLDASSTRLERGQLRQERLAAEVLAACQIGDLERARRSVRAFLAENPATPSAARLRSSCVGAEFFAN
jgi:hypothetical protein